jgi:hypothetical protein
MEKQAHGQASTRTRGGDDLLHVAVRWPDDLGDAADFHGVLFDDEFELGAGLLGGFLVAAQDRDPALVAIHLFERER